MSRPGTHSVARPADSREARLRAVMLEVARRLSAGLSIDRDRFVDEHPDLMPELLEEFELQEIAHRQFLAARRAGPVADDVPPAALDAVPADPDADTLHVDPPREDAEVAVVGYQVLGEVKRGGQATVYRAVMTSTGRAVALKVLEGGPLLTRRRQARLDREADVLANLRHPNIVSVIDRGRTNDGSVYLAMDFIEGPELDQWVRQLGRIDGGTGDGTGGGAADVDDGPPVDAVVELMALVGEAAGEAHAHGVVHRDLKPSNVLVDRRGQPHLLDFGLARVLLDEEEEGVSPAEAARRAVTRTGQVVGSLPWLSPEQAVGMTGGVDARSDVYALGVMLYEALTQRPPYATDGTLADALRNIADAVPPPPGRVRGGVPPAVDAVVMKALSKDPADRYADARAMARDLRAWLAGRAVTAPKYRRPVRWRRAGLAAAVAVVAGVAAAGVWLATRGGPPANARVPDPPPASATTTVSPPPPTRRTVVLLATHDAYVRPGKDGKKPLGRETFDNDLHYHQLQVRTAPDLEMMATRDSYLKFDLSKIPARATIASARLYVYGAVGPVNLDPLVNPLAPADADPAKAPAARHAAPPGKGPAPELVVSAHGLKNRREDWDEVKVTFDTRPIIKGYASVATSHGSVAIRPGPPAWHMINLTGYVREERAANEADPAHAIRWLTVALHVAEGRNLWAQFYSSEAAFPPRVEVEVE